LQHSKISTSGLHTVDPDCCFDNPRLGIRHWAIRFRLYSFATAMNDFAFRILHRLHFLKRSTNAHGIHSPFVFDFFNNVLHDHREFAAFSDIEKLRSALIHDQRMVQTNDLGSGNPQPGQQTVGIITRKSSINPKDGRLLFRMVHTYRPSNIIELGTSVGIGTLYLASSIHSIPVFTLEGSPEVATVARENFTSAGAANIESLTGSFEQLLPPLLKRIATPGLVFIDGNHRFAPTTWCFKLLSDAADEYTILVFHDINWSEEMYRAWKAIVGDDKSNLTIELARCGLVFFRKGIPKQHFVLR